MRRKHIILIGASFVTVVVSGLANYAARAQPRDPPVWLSSWAVLNRIVLASLVLGLSIFNGTIEGARAYLGERLATRAVVGKVVDDFAKTMFKDQTKWNRVTLFQVKPGWRVFLGGIFRLPLFAKGYKWRALAVIKFRDDYLAVYHRPADVRNRKSTAAFKVSDDARECEGIAGRVWEEGFCMVPNLTPPDRDEVRAAHALEGSPQAGVAREYAAATNIKDLDKLKGVDNFARHFLGTVIRRGDGRPWGVLLLDSEAAKCPFPSDAASSFVERFNDCARVIGKIIA